MHLRKTLYLTGLILFFAGMSASAGILLFHPPNTDSQITEETADRPPGDLKTGRRQMEMVGGKANILAGELSQWFSSLWHGTRLAITIFFLTITLCAGIFWTADRMN